MTESADGSWVSSASVEAGNRSACLKEAGTRVANVASSPVVGTQAANAASSSVAEVAALFEKVGCKSVDKTGEVRSRNHGILGNSIDQRSVYGRLLKNEQFLILRYFFTVCCVKVSLKIFLRYTLFRFRV